MLLYSIRIFHFFYFFYFLFELFINDDIFILFDMFISNEFKNEFVNIGFLFIILCFFVFTNL